MKLNNNAISSSSILTALHLRYSLSTSCISSFLNRFKILSGTLVIAVLPNAFCSIFMRAGLANSILARLRSKLTGPRAFTCCTTFRNSSSLSILISSSMINVSSSFVNFFVVSRILHKFCIFDTLFLFLIFLSFIYLSAAPDFLAFRYRTANVFFIELSISPRDILKFSIGMDGFIVALPTAFLTLFF